MSTEEHDYAYYTCLKCGRVAAREDSTPPPKWIPQGDKFLCYGCVLCARPGLAAILPSKLADGMAAAVYANEGIVHAVKYTLEQLVEARCAVAMFHSGPDDLKTHAADMAAMVRNRIPDIEIWVAIGCDYKLRQQRLAGNKYDADAVIRHLVTIADTAKQCGAKGIMLDPETELELLGKHSQTMADYVARETLLEISARAPGIPILFTSFDHPTLHGGIPWRALLGPESPVQAAFEQVYAAIKSGYCARGSLEKRETSALGSWAVMVRKGVIRPDIEPDPGPSDMDWFPYVQLHNVPAVDTIRLGVERRQVAGWALGTSERYDEQGRIAWRCIAALRRYGFVGPDAVVRFERAAGLHVDRDPSRPGHDHPQGIAGPEVQEALLALP